MKTTQLSTRVTQEDADFLASLVIEGATTPSDKLRALIHDARKRKEEQGDYAGSLRQVREMIGPASARILEVENDGLPHSELVMPVVEWLTESLAFVLSHVPENGDEERDAKTAVKELESGLADRALRLVGSVLRLGITEDAQCYEPRVLSSRLRPVLELARVVDAARKAAAPLGERVSSRDEVTYS